MTYKIAMAVVEGSPPEHVAAALRLLPATDSVRPQLPLGDAIDHRETHWGVGTLGAFTIVTGAVGDDRRWEHLSKAGRVLVFDIDDQHNALYIYEDGERVARREEKRGSRPWTPSHPLERKIRTKKHQDYIADVFRNLTGTQLVDSMNAVVTMHVLPVVPKPELGPVADELERRLAEPDPDKDWLEGLAWGNRWRSLHDCVERGWEIAPRVVVEEWIPRVVAHLAPWPERRRNLPYGVFERIARKQHDGRYDEFAPLYRTLDLERGRRLDWKPKLFATFFAHPVCRAFTEINASNNYFLPVAFAELLARTEALENVHTLGFDRVGFGNEGAIALARGAHWARLRSLDLRTNIDASVLPAFAASTFAPGLQTLFVYADDFGPIAGELGAAFPALRHLGLAREKTFDDHALRALLESSALPDLEALTLTYWPDNDLDMLRSIRPNLAITARITT